MREKIGAMIVSKLGMDISRERVNACGVMTVF